MSETKNNNKECPVCYENINKSTRKEIICLYCGELCCLSCFKQNLLTSINRNCMHCNKELNIDFISNNTPKVFYNKIYREYRANIEFSKEKSLLPITQHLAEEEIERRNRIKNINEVDEEIKNLNSLILTLQHKKNELKEKRYNILTGYKKESVETEKKKVFIKSCPVNGCRGYLDQNWICGICNTKTCNKCHIPLTEGQKIEDGEHKDGDQENIHVCNKETVMSIKAINKETRSCPTCGIPIFKTEGCDQMWCIECKTAFSWITGEIEQGRVHNPHYYEWQRKNNNGVAPRVPGDNPCEQIDILPTQHVVFTKLKSDNKSKNIKKIIYNAHMLSYDITNFSYRPELTPELIENIADLKKQDLRVSFLLNEISEESWKLKLKQIQKESEKKICIIQIMNIITFATIDIFNTYIVLDINIEDQLEELRNYINNCFIKISKRFNCVTGNINQDWTTKGNIFRGI